MNYLSHYFVENAPADPYLTMGLILPDLAGATQRGWKPVLPDSLPDAYEHRQLAMGVRRHLQADALFHNSEFFRLNSRKMANLFREHRLAPEGVKLFFAGHIFLEMMLDRLLVKEASEVSLHFYVKLNLVEHHHVAHYLRKTSPVDEERFRLFFSRFREHRFLLRYAIDEDLYFSFTRIMMRAKQLGFSQDMPEKFCSLVADAENELSPHYQAYFETLSKDLAKL